jgi:hypothetical protein
LFLTGGIGRVEVMLWRWRGMVLGLLIFGCKNECEIDRALMMVDGDSFLYKAKRKKRKTESKGFLDITPRLKWY